jgi:aminomethyltransferase
MRRAAPLTHFRQPLLHTPFHPRIAALMSTHQWYNWGGYAAATVIRDEEMEYFALRNTSSLFDISPMVKYRITGRGAEAYLNRLCVRDVARLRPGRVHYTAWCDDAGMVLDDGTLFRLGENDFRLCCQERHLPWLLESAFGFDVEVREETEEIAAVSLQGPTSCAILKRAGFENIETMKPFDLRAFPTDGGREPVIVSRTGFSGDLGYELFVAAADALAVWDLLTTAGEPHGLHAIGFAALDVARLEAGFITCNSDFIAAEHAVEPDRRRSPYEIGLGWLVDLDKAAYFNGRRALAAEKANGTSRYVLVRLEIDGNIPADHALVYSNKHKEVGHVTASAWSPTTKSNLALATLHRPYGDTVTDDLWVEIYAQRELVYHRLMMRAHVTAGPFFNPPRRRATPPADF